ncbi:putative ribonuclease H-like domain-containing protein [Tanacetum coccineum]
MKQLILLMKFLLLVDARGTSFFLSYDDDGQVFILCQSQCLIVHRLDNKDLRAHIDTDDLEVDGISYGRWHDLHEGEEILKEGQEGSINFMQMPASAPRNQGIEMECFKKVVPVETLLMPWLLLMGWVMIGANQAGLEVPMTLLLMGPLSVFSSSCHQAQNLWSDYQDIDGGFVAFAGSPKGGKITGKENSVLFTAECLILSPDFKLLDESQVLLKVPKQDNMYSFDLKKVVPSGGLTCLIAKATIDESNLWHKRLGRINLKTMNKLVRGNLVRGLPSKHFENDHSCVACQKGKLHKASCKTKHVSSIRQPLQMLHMDLFGPTFVRSINQKIYCLVVTDDYSRFSWVFFLATKDETNP